MTDGLTTYLRSPEAEADAKAILDGRGASGTLQHGLFYGRAGQWQMIRPDRNAEVAACWIATGPTFTVSDLGYGTLARRLRTGDLTHPSDLSRSQDPRRWQRVVDALDSIPDEGGWQGDALVVRNVSPDALPRTLCAVLLAAHMLGQL